MGLAGVFDPGALTNVSVFTVVGEGCSRFVETKWSVAQLLMVKHTCFDNFFLQDASGPPVVALASQSSSQMPPTYPPNASQTPPEVPKEVCLGSLAGVIYLFKLIYEIYVGFTLNLC